MVTDKGVKLQLRDGPILRYEYHIFDYYPLPEDDDIVEKINELGSSSWELVAVALTGPTSKMHRAYFRRIIEK